MLPYKGSRSYRRQFVFEQCSRTAFMTKGRRGTPGRRSHTIMNQAAGSIEGESSTAFRQSKPVIPIFPCTPIIFEQPRIFEYRTSHHNHRGNNRIPLDQAYRKSRHKTFVRPMEFISITGPIRESTAGSRKYVRTIRKGLLCFRQEFRIPHIIAVEKCYKPSR